MLSMHRALYYYIFYLNWTLNFQKAATRPHISLNVLVFGLLLLHHYLTSVHFPQSLYHETLDHQIDMDLNPS